MSANGYDGHTLVAKDREIAALRADIARLRRELWDACNTDPVEAMRAQCEADRGVQAMRRLTAADEELFHELWAGTLFDLIHAVDTKRPEWEEGERGALVFMVIEELARRYGLVEDDEERPTSSLGGLP